MKKNLSIDIYQNEILVISDVGITEIKEIDFNYIGIYKDGLIISFINSDKFKHHLRIIHKQITLTGTMINLYKLTI